MKNQHGVLKKNWDESGTKLFLTCTGMGIYLAYRLARDKFEEELFRLVSGTGGEQNESKIR